MASRMMAAETMSVITGSRPYPTSMRSLRSFKKTTSTTPLSTPLRPTFHCSARRMETSSRLSPSSEGKIAMTICAPVARSRSASLLSSRWRSAADRTPAWSLTRAVGAGGRVRARARTTPRSSLELHFGRRLGAGRRLEERLGPVTAHRGHETSRNELHAAVVLLDGLIEVSPRDGDPVLRPLELGHQTLEDPVGFQLRVALDGDEQPAERAGQLALRGRELLHRLGIVERFGRQLEAAGGVGAGLRDLGQHRALLLGEAPHGLFDVRDEVEAALVLRLHLRPARVHVLIEPDEVVGDRDVPCDEGDDEDGHHREDDQDRTHAGRIILDAVSETLPVYRVTAKNTSTGENKIHDDATARRHGFRGALVPGVTVYAYMTQPLAIAFGPAWLRRGTASVRFVKPVLDGEEVIVSGVVTVRDATGVTATLTASTAATPECATLTATIPAGLPTPVNLAGYREALLPEPRPEATREHWTSLATLGTPRAHYDVAAAEAYLAKVGEALALYRGVGGWVHPGFLLEQGNRAVDRNVRMGPWIHTGSVVRHLGGARVGERLATRGRVRSLFEKKGREFVELDLVVTAGEPARPVAHVLHTAIYRLPPPE